MEYELILNPIELRVIGALIEKEMTTPEYYPMTFNALVAACNQKSNRDPVMELTGEQVKGAVERLRLLKLAVQEMNIQQERVPKIRQSWSNVAGLGADEKAVMAELILRGPQTLGELRGRCARMHEFADLNAVQLTLDGLMEREGGALVSLLPRQAGYKERRYAQLLGGPVAVEEEALAPEPGAGTSRARAGGVSAELDALRQEVAGLREEVGELRRMFEEFRRQFE